MMIYLVALLLAGHGVAHLVGFVVPWRIARLEEMPYGTTLLGGRVDVGDSGIRLVGVLWLLGALAFWGSAAALLLMVPWWGWLTMGVSVFSLVLCVFGWPQAKIGVPVNLLVLTVVVVDFIWGWLTG
jgi:hypothetical protein